MKINEKTFFRVSALVSALVSLTAFAEIKPDTKYICGVIQSNSPGIPVGSVTKELSLRTIAGGAIPFPKGFIDFYGPLSAFEANAPGSRQLVLAQDPAYPRELYGTVFVAESGPNRITLDVSLIHTTRSYDAKAGKQVFLLGSQIVPPQFYKMNCVGR